MRARFSSRRVLIAFCLVLSVTAVGPRSDAAVAEQPGIHAGAAAVNIDPPKLPVIRNGGFAQKMAATIEQSLFARSLVLEEGGKRVAICVVDTCMMDRELCDRAKALVTRETGIREDRILLSATHTHSAPSVMRCLGCPADPDYPDFLVPKILESVVLAAETVRPAEVGWAVADAGDYTNTRRWIYLPHKMPTDPYGQVSVRAMMHPGHANPATAGPAGPEDPDLTLLSIRERGGGRPLAVLGNLSQHYYAQGELSSGYTGRFCALLEEEFGEAFVGLMSQGTSGDLQYMDYSRPRTEQPFAGEDDPYEAYCRSLAGLAIQSLKQVDYRADCPLAMAEAKLTLQRRLPDEERIAWARPIVESLGDRLPRNRPEVLATEVFWLLDNPTEELKLQALRIGDFGIATLPNEVYGITGLKLKLQSPLGTLMNIELANGAVGYIPPPEQHALGGYTTWPARTAGLEIDAEPKIVETLLGLLEDVAEAPRRIPNESAGVLGREILSLGPAAWWRMSAHSGDRIVDASGSGNDARLEPGCALFLDGPTGEADAFGAGERGNRAVHFAGGRMVSEKPLLAPGMDYSVGLWFWNAMPQDVRPVTGYLCSIGCDEDAQGGDHLGISGTADGPTGSLMLYNGDARRETVIGRTSLELHRWYHVLLTREGDTVRVYLNGRAEPEILSKLTDTRDAGRVFVGGRSDGRFGFEGKIDEVAVFDRALERHTAAALASVASAETAEREQANRSNVLFIAVDDLRTELGCYGADYIHSPNIDRLAAEGVLFNRAYCQWAVCMPSRASVLTGLRPDTFDGQAAGWRKIVPDTVTLPQHFKNNGYFAQSFGKIYHGAWESAYVGNSFQDPASWSAPRWACSPRYYFSEEGVGIARQVFAGAGDKFLRNVKRDPSDPDQWTRHFVRGLATEAPDVPDEVPGDGQITQAALAALDRLAADAEPFFLAVGYMKPHLPFIAPKRYWDLYDADKIPPIPQVEVPVGVPTVALTDWGELRSYTDMPGSGPLTSEQIRNLRHGYAACVSYVDAQVGILLDDLDRRGLREKTIVVLWADHGFKLGDMGMWCKHTNFELDTRVPLIVSAPGYWSGTTSDALVELVDLYPTLSDLAGLPKPAGAEGISFAPLVRDPTARGEDAAFSQYPRGTLMGRSVRTSRFRYTEWQTKNGAQSGPVAIELYDYDSEGENRNVAEESAYRKELANLRSLLRERP